MQTTIDNLITILPGIATNLLILYMVFKPVITYHKKDKKYFKTWKKEYKRLQRGA